ncbi:hypothetical protein FA13DRAFT_1785904 [Coprinellus micaceus]|uniref:Uncharacterized protein n=1 Tax=Coprinellus micaceus TaxID=71717 RepID=A0A4Y7TWX1_COPMI|nr:hypothetical protein FA13DRAFT_1785904 [Coprinellus micaceus]
MVVIDSYESIRSKKAPAAGNSTTSQNPHPADEPPPYGAQQGTYHVSTPGESRQPLLSPPIANEGGNVSGYAVVVRGEPTWKRFGKALVVAVGIYMLFAMFLRSWVWNLRWDGMRHHNWPESYPIPPGLETGRCADPPEWGTQYGFRPEAHRNHTTVDYGYPLSINTKFTLPVNAESLYLLSRGAHSSGSVDILTSATQARDSVTVVVTAKYYNQRMRDVVKVCQISRRKGEEGVGIFTPKYTSSYAGDQVFFETLIVFPEWDGNQRQTPLIVKSFETDVQNTLHRVHGVADQVKFAKLRLQGSNGPISATSLSVEEGRVETSNAGISGAFNTTKSLDISTSNGPVLVFVKVVNGYHLSDPSRLSIETANGPLEANVELYANSRVTHNGPDNPSSTKPTYYVGAKTSNNRLQTHFWHQPADSTLRFHGTTRNGPAKAQLHPAYQGPFEAKTSNSSPRIEVREENPPDSSGKSRTRKVYTHSIANGRLSGNVDWVPRRGGPGSVPGKSQVVLETSNAQAMLLL